MQYFFSIAWNMNPVINEDKPDVRKIGSHS